MRPFQRRNEEEIQERRKTAYDLKQQGIESRYIAQRLGVSPAYVNQLVKDYRANSKAGKTC
jgi:transposase